MATSTAQNSSEASKAAQKKIWKVAGILALLTAAEFLVAFTVPHEMTLTRISIFIGMTIVKAFYIVADFMHLKHEVKVLLWSIILPMIFVVWFIVALIMEGESVANAIYQ